MIYFLTDWRLDKENFERDIFFNVVRTFNESNRKTTVIQTVLSPFLNYFVTQFDFEQKDTIYSLFELIHPRKKFNVTPLCMSDLPFPSYYEKTYTKDKVILSMNGEIKSEAYFNTFGFVSAVHNFSKEGIEISIYSEKGYLLSKEFFNPKGKRVKKQLFDGIGQLILTEWEIGVKISRSYLQYFEYEVYESLASVSVELLNRFLENFNPREDRLIIDGRSSWLLELVKDFLYPESIVYVFSGKIQQNVKNIDDYFHILNKAKSIITDDSRLQKIVHDNNKYRSLRGKLSLLPLYPTELNLGRSNMYAEQYIYWKINQFTREVREVFSKFLRKKLSLDELCLFIDYSTSSDERELQQFLEDFTRQTFEVEISSSEYQLVQQYYEALKNEEMTPHLREVFMDAKKNILNFTAFIDAYLFMEGIVFRCHSSLSEFKEDLSKCRVFLDQRDSVEFFSHALAVSAGLPLIVKQSSPYVFENKNGKILRDYTKFNSAVESYLLDPDLWNQNLVESVEIIQTYSAEGLMNQWEEEIK